MIICVGECVKEPHHWGASGGINVSSQRFGSATSSLGFGRGAAVSPQLWGTSLQLIHDSSELVCSLQLPVFPVSNFHARSQDKPTYPVPKVITQVTRPGWRTMDFEQRLPWALPQCRQLVGLKRPSKKGVFLSVWQTSVDLSSLKGKTSSAESTIISQTLYFIF